MTLDISGGFILKGAKSLDDAYKRIPDWLKDSYIKARQISQQSIVSLATELYDNVTVFGESICGSPYDSAFEWIKSALEQESGGVGLGTVVSIGVTSKKRVIGVITSQSKIMREHFMTLPGIQPYNYSVVTGRPRGVTQKQWDARAEDWKSLEINEEYVHMMQYTLVDPSVMFMPSRDDYAIVPSFDARLQKLAKELTMRKCVEEFGLHSEHQFIEFMLRNPLYSERLDTATERLRPMLEQDLTIEKLQKEI